MSKRFLCWDTARMAEHHGVQVLPHKPEKKDLALICDNEWEGPHNGYGSIVRTGDTVRLYYRADPCRAQLDTKTMSPGRAVICVAESRDGGRTFQKPCVGKYEFNGTKYNNIVYDRGKYVDNFSVFYDTNPDCPADEKFKALSEWNYGPSHGGVKLIYFASADGYDFREMGPLPIRGTFDTYNVTFWDAETKQYFLYYRGFHGKADGEDHLRWGLVKSDDVRDVRVATSPDFRTWTEHGRITFEAGQTDMPMYTNQITPYFRAPGTFIGFPVRYNDRATEKRNFDFMPLADRHRRMTELWGREGTAVTDCVVMTSGDGFTFNRRDEAFMTPGPESPSNWWYGNCYTVYGLLETAADEAGAPNEISFYMGENYRIKSVNFRRYTLRLDGFFSWYAPYAGGEVLTTPIPVNGDTLKVNFATSAMGGMTVTLCDLSGAPLAGYNSYVMFGNSVDRPVEFEQPLSALNGQTVRLRIRLSDAHLYSFTLE